MAGADDALCSGVEFSQTNVPLPASGDAIEPLGPEIGVPRFAISGQAMDRLDFWRDVRCFSSAYMAEFLVVLSCCASASLSGPSAVEHRLS